MSWNYRLIHSSVARAESLGGGRDDYYAIHEVYYDDAGRPVAVTETPEDVGGETPESARETYRMMAEAFAQPVLDMADFDRMQSWISGGSEHRAAAGEAAP